MIITNYPILDFNESDSDIGLNVTIIINKSKQRSPI